MPQRCIYVPRFGATFGRTITDHEIDREFQEIERTFDCFADLLGERGQETTIHDHGVIDGSYIIEPGLGIIHYMECLGDVNLTVAQPQGRDPRLITLIIGNAGSVATENYGRFNFQEGVVWSHDRDDVMDGKPWNMYANLDGSTTGTRYDGFYGAAVQCVHDGVGWLHLVWARHHLNIFGATNPDDIYDWR